MNLSIRNSSIVAGQQQWRKQLTKVIREERDYEYDSVCSLFMYVMLSVNTNQRQSYYFGRVQLLSEQNVQGVF